MDRKHGRDLTRGNQRYFFSLNVILPNFIVRPPIGYVHPQESLANAKVSARQQCVYDGP